MELAVMPAIAGMKNPKVVRALDAWTGF
jgi:hypothetical protein